MTCWCVSVISFLCLFSGTECKKSQKHLSHQEIGIAKLSGFREWFSNHFIFRESEDVDSVEMGLCSQKTIIFAHHLKVLDGIQVRHVLFSIYYYWYCSIWKNWIFEEIINNYEEQTQTQHTEIWIHWHYRQLIDVFFLYSIVIFSDKYHRDHNMWEFIRNGTTILVDTSRNFLACVKLYSVNFMSNTYPVWLQVTTIFEVSIFDWLFEVSIFHWR